MVRAVAVPEFRAAPRLLEVPVPPTGPNELRVRLEFAGMNPLDWKIADGLYEGRRPHLFPLILGVDGAGVVEEAGADVRRFRLGERVFGSFLHDPVGLGTYTTTTVVPESNAVAPVPASLGAAEAAALPTAGMTALAGLETAGPSAGRTLLIAGASGGVGSFAVLIGHALGFGVVALARPSSHARLRSLGADRTIDPGPGAAVAQVRAELPAGADLLLDLMDGPEAFGRLAGAVRTGGLAVSTIGAAPPGGRLPNGVGATNLNLAPSPSLLERLGRLVVDRKLAVPVERSISLEEAPAAISDSRAGRSSGKTVIRL
jgi:NADPH:quinone reductase-like Zn-dependent oxidoreductase